MAPAATVATAEAALQNIVKTCPFVEQVTALKTQVKGVRTRLTAKLDLAKDVNAFIDSVSGVDLAGECISVYNKAKELRPKIETLASVAEVEQKRTEAEGEFDKLKEKVLKNSACRRVSTILRQPAWEFSEFLPLSLAALVG